jgi:hypothetical protein
LHLCCICWDCVSCCPCPHITHVAGKMGFQETSSHVGASCLSNLDAAIITPCGHLSHSHSDLFRMHMPAPLQALINSSSTPTLVEDQNKTASVRNHAFLLHLMEKLSSEIFSYCFPQPWHTLQKLVKTQSQTHKDLLILQIMEHLLSDAGFCLFCLKSILSHFHQIFQQ